MRIIWEWLSTNHTYAEIAIEHRISDTRVKQIILRYAKEFIHEWFMDRKFDLRNTDALEAYIKAVGEE